MENSVFNDTRKDLSNLLECLKLHEDNEEINEIQEVLKTVVLVCSTTAEAKDILRELDGLSLIFDVLCKTKNIVIVEAALNTLANVMDKNVHNQKIMSRKEVFQVIRGILNDGTSPSSLMKKTLFFTSVLLFQNSKAQILIQQTNCLQDLIDMYEQHFPSSMLDKLLSFHLKTSEGRQPSAELWLHVNRTLCFAVNNPLSCKNQTVCSALFPMALRILQASSDCEIIGAVSTFLTVTLENNVYNKDLFAEYDGTVVLKYCFLKGLDYILKDIDTYNDIVNKRYAEAAVFSVVDVLDIALSDHSQNSELMGKLGFIPWLLKLLKIDVINEEWKVKLLLTIGHCIDAYEKNIAHLMDEKELPSLLRMLMENGDKDLLSACQYLIQVCLKSSDPFMKQKLSANEQEDEEDAMDVDVKSCDETIDLSSPNVLHQDNVNKYHPQEQSAEDIVDQIHNVVHGKSADCQIFQEESYFHVNVNNATAVHDDGCNGDQNNSLRPGKNTEFPSEQCSAEPMTQTLSDDDDDDVFVLGESKKNHNLCCDYCSCESRVISKYTCGCAVLHGCRCQNITCLNSCHMSCPVRTQTASSNECEKYGCEKLCKDASLCKNPHKFRRKSFFDECRENSGEKHMTAGEVVKPGVYRNENNRSSSSSSSSKSVTNFFPKFFSRKKDTHEKQNQNIPSSYTTSEAPLKENKCANLKMAVKPKTSLNVFKKPQERPIAKSKQSALQDGGPRCKSSKFFSRCHSSASASFQHSLKCDSSVNKTRVSFSPFRKSDLPESGLHYKMDDTRSFSETAGSEKLSVFDVKLLKASRHTSALKPPLFKHEQQKSGALQQVKVQQNNENRATSETVSKYFSSSRESPKQCVPSVKDQLCAKPDVSANGKQSCHQKKKFFPSSPCGSRTPLWHENKECITSYFHVNSGAETVNDKDVNCDTDVQVISVFGSTCSKHNLSNSSEVVQVITLES